MSDASELRAATVAWFDDKKGFGSIDVPDGTRAFVHRSVLPGVGYRTLVKGEPVLIRTEPVPGKDPRVVELESPPQRIQGVVDNFDFAKGFGFIRGVSGGASENLVFVHHSSVMTSSGRAELIAGEDVEYFAKPTERGLQAIHVKRLDPRAPWEKFSAYHDSNWEKLALLAEREVWDFQSPASGDEGDGPGGGSARFPILISYIRYTFAKIVEDGLIAYGLKGGISHAAFNTGLVTDSQEDIYGFFVAKSPADDGCSWRFFDWVKASDNRVSGVFSPRPQMAKYWDDPSVLFFDPRKDLVLDSDHFIRDNIDRYPAEYRKSPQLALAFTMAAKDAAIKRLMRNYKTAIPQYHRGEIQLLLPLSLDGSGKAQLALVARRQVSEETGELVEYTGETVLPLHAALNNARLLARPDRDWLNP
ncbi:DUF3825 domain-containing protein [Streptomyces sp. NPDC096132]|uniref:DUF3825 domain-containing protein n=1 Tax=Streptomyces sp. NPDC096132 TaxID=3366075 RepID=UPI00381B434D